MCGCSFSTRVFGQPCGSFCNLFCNSFNELQCILLFEIGNLSSGIMWIMLTGLSFLTASWGLRGPVVVLSLIAGPHAKAHVVSDYICDSLRCRTYGSFAIA
jgi:hypothetical protein